MSATAKEFLFSVTGYRGHELEVLAMRNRNRKIPQTRAHMDWRYEGERTGKPPLVFWLRDKDGRPVAMAALIFRAYSVAGRECLFAVLGDISVEHEHRGRGLFQELLRHINRHIQENNFDCAFVMANQLAEKGLAAAGWKRAGEMPTLVIVTDATGKILRWVKVKPVAAIFSAIMRGMIRLLIRRKLMPNVTQTASDFFDGDFEAFWENFPKAALVLRSRNAAVLRWRYQQHPEARYAIHKYHADGRFVGYLIAALPTADGACLVEDFFVEDKKWVQPCMALFLRHSLADRTVKSVRITVNEGCACLPLLKKLGYVQRYAAQPFQILAPRHAEIDNPRAWFVMAGDKDAL